MTEKAWDYKKSQWMDPIPLEQCKERRIYRINSRNLTYGVFDGNKGFIGIREKFGERFLFREYHWDTGPPFGTVKPLEDIGIDLPLEIDLNEHDYGGEARDRETLKPVKFDRPISEGGRGWYFLDGSEGKIYPKLFTNKKLFNFLKKIEDVRSNV